MNQRQYSAEEIRKIVKAEQTELHYNQSAVSIHAARCGHGRFASEVSSFDVKGALADDWFYVAPCAKRATVKA